MKLDTLIKAIRGCVNARMVALSQVISEIFPFQSIEFLVSNCLKHISMRR